MPAYVLFAPQEFVLEALIDFMAFVIASPCSPPLVIHPFPFVFVLLSASSASAFPPTTSTAFTACPGTITHASSRNEPFARTPSVPVASTMVNDSGSREYTVPCLVVPSLSVMSTSCPSSAFRCAGFRLFSACVEDLNNFTSVDAVAFARAFARLLVSSSPLLLSPHPEVPKLETTRGKHTRARPPPSFVSRAAASPHERASRRNVSPRRAPPSSRASIAARVTRAHSHRSVGAPPNVRRGDAREIARASRASRAVAARAARKFARRNYAHRIARSTHLGVHRARRRRAVRARARAAAGDRLARVVAVAVAVRVDAARIARRSTRVRIRAFDRARERARGEHARRDGRREASARSVARAPRPTPYPHARRGGLCRIRAKIRPCVVKIG